jgi:hypothetical protein
MANIQTSTIRVPKDILDSIKIYCKKNGRNVGDWVESAWKFIERNDFDIYDEEATPCLPVQEQPQGMGVAALCNLMAEFINTSTQKQLPDNNREEEIRRMDELIKWYQGKIDEKDEELMHVREALHHRTNKLEKAKGELRRLKKGMFNRPDEQVLQELGIF